MNRERGTLKHKGNRKNIDKKKTERDDDIFKIRTKSERINE